MSEILHGKSVLIVDDESELRECLKDALDLEGCTTLEATCGQEAFALLQTHAVDAIVSDVRMPRGTGMDLLLQVKKLSPEKPVVVLVTGFSDVAEHDAFHCGAHALLHKPFPMAAMVRAVETALTPPVDRWKQLPPLQSHVDIEIQLHSYERKPKGNVVSIGRGGMFIQMTERFPVKGERVTFRIRFKHGSPNLIAGSGIVRWIRPQPDGDTLPGCGIEFVDFSEESRAQILQLVAGIQHQAFIPRE